MGKSKVSTYHSGMNGTTRKNRKKKARTIATIPTLHLNISALVGGLLEGTGSSLLGALDRLGDPEVGDHLADARSIGAEEEDRQRVSELARSKVVVVPG